MATERQAPDAIISSSDYSTLNLADIDEDPDAPDGAWGIWDGNGNTTCRVSFPTPSGNPTTGAGLQEFRVRMRINAPAAAAPDWELRLYETGGGTPLAVVASGLDFTTVDPGEVISGTWDASLLADPTGASVEAELAQTDGGIGGGRRGLEIGAIEWNVTFDAAVSVTPDPVTVPIIAPAPTVTGGAASVTPDPVVVPVVAPAPTVAGGATSVSPDPVAVPIGTPAPTVTGGAVAVTPDPLTIPILSPDPTVTGGAVSVTPDPVAVPVVLPDPVVSIAVLVNPDPVVVTTLLPTPSVQGGLTEATPNPVLVPIVIPVPTVSGGPTSVSPSPVTVILLVPDPAVSNPAGGGPENPYGAIVVTGTQVYRIIPSGPFWRQIP